MKKTILLVGNFLSAKANPTPSEDLMSHLGEAGWHVIASSRFSSRFMRLLDMVTTAIGKRREYALAQISVFSGPAFIWAETVAWVLRQLGKPYILTLHGGALPEFAERRHERVRRLLQSAKIVTAPSGYLIEKMTKYRSDIRLLPNPIELAKYPFRLRSISKPRLVWLRAFHEIYNPELAAKIIANLVIESPDIHLTMIGPDKKDSSLQNTKALIKKLKIAQNISFAGGIKNSEVPTFLNRSDIFINTTNIDNTPVSILEAMACGLCIVSTNVGGIPYLCENEKDALLVPPDDPEAMAYAIERILKDPGLAEQLSKNARKKAEHFDWVVVLPQWEKTLNSVLESLPN